MIKSTQEDLLYISNNFSRILKRSFGKGPESCYTLLKENRLYVYMRNFVTSGEEALINNKEYNLARNFRFRVIQAVSDELVEIVTKVLGTSFDSLYQDWNYESNTGMLLLANQNDYNEVKVEAIFKKDLFDMIIKVGSELHKVPNELAIIKFTQNVCAIEARGSLLWLETHLYEQGEINVLHSRSRKIKKGYLKHKILFEEIFNRSIDDIFIMWDFKNKKNYLIFSFGKVFI